MEQPASPVEPTNSDQPATPASTASGRSPAIEAMVASIERLDALGLDGVEPASAFLWT